MSNLISDQLLTYLESLEQALRLPPEQARPVVDEVRSDLLAHVQRYVDQGQEESQAVTLAIEEMGPADELAAQMRAAIPPLGNYNIRVLRRAAAMFLTLLLLWVFWHVRAMDFGFSIPRALACSVLLTPVALLIWPDVIWRKNWMFTVVPTVVIFLLVFVAMTMGQQTDSMMVIDPNAVPEAGEISDIRDESTADVVGYLVLGLLVALTIYLFTQIQRRRQRWTAIAFSLLAAVSIEAPYAVEEYRYGRQLAQLQDQLQLWEDKGGTYPSDDGFASLDNGMFHYWSQPDGSGYNLFWDRPLNPGYAICYSSKNNRMWIND